MRRLLNQKTTCEDPTFLKDFLHLVEQDAKFLRASYPSFDNWLFQKVVPGISTGERTVVIEYRSSTPVGLLIVKHTAEERKLCTLRIRPHFENKGLGLKLFETAFELLETDRPLLSVSETTLPKFSKLFDHFGFAQEASYEGVYLPREVELAFNGLLSDHAEHSVICKQSRSSSFHRHMDSKIDLFVSCFHGRSQSHPREIGVRFQSLS